MVLCTFFKAGWWKLNPFQRYVCHLGLTTFPKGIAFKKWKTWHQVPQKSFKATGKNGANKFLGKKQDSSLKKSPGGHFDEKQRQSQSILFKGTFERVGFHLIKHHWIHRVFHTSRAQRERRSCRRSTWPGLSSHWRIERWLGLKTFGELNEGMS